MAITQAYEIDGVTISTNEISIVSGTTSLQTIADAGCFQLWVDAYAMAKGDEFRVRIYEKVEVTGGSKKVVFQATLVGVQTEIFVTPPLVLMYGWDMTLLRIAGADRAFDASIRKIA